MCNRENRTPAPGRFPYGLRLCSRRSWSCPDAIATGTPPIEFQAPAAALALYFASTMADSVICVTFELHVRIFPAHPEIERVVKEKIRQYWADDSPLWRALFP